MSQALKDFVVACGLTVACLAIGLLLASAEAHAGPADLHPQGACKAEMATSGKGWPYGCGLARPGPVGRKLVRFGGPPWKRAAVHAGSRAAE